MYFCAVQVRVYPAGEGCKKPESRKWGINLSSLTLIYRLG